MSASRPSLWRRRPAPSASVRHPRTGHTLRFHPHGVLLVMLVVVLHGGTTQLGAQRASPDPLAATESRSVPELSTRIDVELQGASLAEALEAISRLARLPLSYSHAMLAEGHVVWLSARSIRVDSALHHVLGGTDLRLLVLPSRQLVLTRNGGPDVTTPAAVSGTLVVEVVDAVGGTSLEGVRIALGDAGPAGLTAAGGALRIEAPPGHYRVVAGTVGYLDQAKEITIRADRTAVIRFHLVPAAISLPRVVATASTAAASHLRLRSSPLTVLTSEDLRERNVLRVDDLFRGLVPGLLAADHGAGSYSTTIHVRGTTSLQSGISGIKTYIDGVEVAQHNLTASLSPEMIERIELLRGPQAAGIHGPAAIDGVLLITTRRADPRGGPRVRAGVTVGSIEGAHREGLALLHDHHLEIGGGGRDVGFSVVGGYRQTGEWQPANGSRRPSLQASGRVRRGRVEADVSARTAWTTFDFAENPILREAGLEHGSLPPMERLVLIQQTRSLDLRYVPDPVWQHQIVVGEDAHRFALRDDPTESEAEPGSSSASMGHARRLSLSYRVLGTHEVAAGPALAFAAGADHQRLEEDADETGDSPAERARRWDAGAFGQLTATFGRSVQLVAGLRTDRSREHGGAAWSALSPRVGAALSRSRVTLRAAYGEALRPPPGGAASEVRSDTRRRLANPRLMPERQHGWDAGIEVHVTDDARLSLGRYRQEAVGLIESVLVDASTRPMLYQSQNVGRILNAGWELEADARIGSVRVLGAATTMRSRVASLSPTYTGAQVVGSQLLGVPTYSGGVQLMLPIARHTRASATLTHRGSWTDLDLIEYYRAILGAEPLRASLADYRTRYAPVTRVDLGISQQLSASLSANLRVQNAFNHLRPEIGNAFPATGRITMLGARFAR